MLLRAVNRNVASVWPESETEAENGGPRQHPNADGSRSANGAAAPLGESQFDAFGSNGEPDVDQKFAGRGQPSDCEWMLRRIWLKLGVFPKEGQTRLVRSLIRLREPYSIPRRSISRPTQLTGLAP